MTAYRDAQRAQRPVLGTRVDGREAARIVGELVDEGYSKGEIAIALGHQVPILHLRERVTLRTVLRLRVLRRRQTT